jgi:protein-disulfide isomerase
MLMSKELRTMLLVGLVVVGVFGVLIAATRYKSSSMPTTAEALVRDGSHSLGPTNAKVTLVEFGDYQCPACYQAEPTIERIADEYKDSLRLVFRHFPLPQHKNAIPAARAVEAANVQGKFWDMHRLIYKNQPEWSESNDAASSFSAYAAQLNLDMNKYRSDTQGNAYSEIIRQDQEDGSALNVNATPTFFLNGEKLDGLPAYDELKGRIDRLLQQ